MTQTIDKIDQATKDAEQTLRHNEEQILDPQSIGKLVELLNRVQNLVRQQVTRPDPNDLTTTIRAQEQEAAGQRTLTMLLDAHTDEPVEGEPPPESEPEPGSPRAIPHDSVDEQATTHPLGANVTISDGHRLLHQMKNMASRMVSRRGSKGKAAGSFRPQPRWNAGWPNGSSS